MQNLVKILGARGSLPRSGPEYIKYGGSTTCAAVRLAGQIVVLDAGTGILKLPEVLLPGERQIPLVLTHAHVDHLLGLPMCPCVFDPAFRFAVYGAERDGRDTEAQLRCLLSPPLWPVGPDGLPAQFRFHTLADTAQLGSVTVDALEGEHPGGVSVLRLTGGGKKVVFATDCTLTETLFPVLADFAADCDLLMIDGQYKESEWTVRSKFGHSTYAAAAQLGKACGAKKTRIVHHDPDRTDAALDAAAGELDAICPNCSFALAGEEISL